MRIIPKYQQGNPFSGYFRVFKPFIPQPETTRQTASSSRRKSSSESDDKEKGKLTEKDLFTLFKDIKNGLPNDTDVLFKKFSSILQQASDLGEDGINDISTLYMSVLQQLPHLESSKKEFENAYNRAVQSGSLNDIAITTSGHVLATDLESGKMIPLTPEQWAKRKKGQYEAITNGNLLWLRRESPQYAGRDDIFQVVQNGISLEGVHKMIKDRLNIGSQTSSYDQFMSREGVMGIDMSKLDENQKKGIEALQQIVANGPNGYYKNSSESTGATDQQIAAAIAYIYQTLPDNAKTRLAIEGDGTRKTVEATIMALITGQLNSTIKNNYSYIGKGGTGENGEGSDGFEEDKSKWTMAQRLQNGMGRQESITLNFGDNNYTTTLGTTMPLVGKNEVPLQIGNSLGSAREGSYGGIFNWNSITVGGVPISSLSASQMIVRDGDITMIDYPCTIDSAGRVIPIVSEKVRKNKAEAEQEIRSKGINLDNIDVRKQRYQEINNIYEKHGISPRYNKDGELNNGAWAEFGIVNIALDGDSAMEIGESMLQQITGRDAELISSYLKENNDGIKYSKKVYQGQAWIPLKVSNVAAMATAEGTETQVRNQYDRDRARETQQNLTLGKQLS